MTTNRSWSISPRRVGDLVVPVATRIGVAGHGGDDAPTSMLAEAMSQAMSQANPGGEASAGAAIGVANRSGWRSLHLASGNGLVAAVAHQRGALVTAIDRYAPHAEASRRTLEANDVAGAADCVRHAVLPANPPDPIADASQDVVTIRLPTDRVGVHQAVCEAYRVLRVGGLCWLAGANDEGARTAAKTLAQQFGNMTVEDQRSGCRLVRAVRTTLVPADPVDCPWTDPLLAHEIDTPIAGVPTRLYTRPGVFSWEHLDDATQILLGVLDIPVGASVLDLGCGAGALSVAAARLSGTGRVLGVDADSDAIRCARLTVREAAESVPAIARVEFRSSDIADAVGSELFDVVVMNPPFHLGKALAYAIPTAFIEAAEAHLKPGGSLFLVANRQLPYERLVAERFGAVRTLHDGRRFKVLGATR